MDHFWCFMYISPDLSDYRAIDRSLIFNSATRSQMVTVYIQDDMLVENQSEEFFIKLRVDDSAVILNRQTTRVTIKDNDSELSMNISVMDLCV